MLHFKMHFHDKVLKISVSNVSFLMDYQSYWQGKEKLKGNSSDVLLSLLNKVIIFLYLGYAWPNPSIFLPIE